MWRRWDSPTIGGQRSPSQYLVITKWTQFSKKSQTWVLKGKITKILNSDKMVEQPVYFELLVAPTAQAWQGLGRGSG